MGRPTPTTALGVVDTIPRGLERIMVVDDEPAVAAFLSNALARFGYRTSAFTSADAAIAQLADPTQHFDLVITDMTIAAALR